MSLPQVSSVTIPQPGLPNAEISMEKPVEKSRQCPICKVYYKYGNSYWQHVRYVHANFLSQCIICGKSYKRTTMAKQHVLYFHKIAWHLCSNYVKKVKKNDHQSQNKIKEKSVERKKQNLKYFKKKTLHLITRFNCYDCPGTFTTIDELFEHVKVHRNKEESGSDIESDADAIQEDAVNEADEMPNGSLNDDPEEVLDGSVNESNDAEDPLASEPENDRSASANEMEDVQEGLSSEEIPNGSANEFETIENTLTNDADFNIQ